MPARFRPAARARRLVAPVARSSPMIGARSAARLSARAWTAATPLALASVERVAPRSPPSFTPRAFAAASAALVRAEMARRSSSATMAITPTVSRLAFGMSAATNSMPAFSSPRRKPASRLSLSSFAKRILAP